MKKILAVSFCTTLVLGFAASAFAIHIEAPAETSAVIAKGGLVTLDGALRTRGALYSTSTAKDATNQAARYDQRVRFGATVKTGDAVTGRVHLETGDNQGDTYTWGSGSSAGLFSGGDKQGTLSVLEAWIQYVPSNWGVKVGHMPLALGNKLFFDHTFHGDDAIVAFMNPNDATHIAALTIKFEEGVNTPASYSYTGTGTVADPIVGPTYNPAKTNAFSKYSDDINGYVLLGTYKAGAMNFGADWTYLTKGVDEVSDFAGLSMSNIGIRGDMDAGNFKLKGDLEFQTGKLYDDPLNKAGMMDSLGNPVTEVDAEGWAGYLDGSTKVGGAWTLGAGLYYGSGHKLSDPATEQGQFVDFLGNTRYQSTMNGYILASPATGMKNTGIANQTLVQLYGTTTTQMMGKDLKLKARLNWMKVNEEVYTNQDDAIGTEIELFADWKLAQGLTYGVEAAYLFTGDAWIPANATMTGPLAGADVDNVFFLRHRLELAW